MMLIDRLGTPRPISALCFSALGVCAASHCVIGCGEAIRPGRSAPAGKADQTASCRPIEFDALHLVLAVADGGSLEIAAETGEGDVICGPTFVRSIVDRLRLNGRPMVVPLRDMVDLLAREICTLVVLSVSPTDDPGDAIQRLLGRGHHAIGLDTPCAGGGAHHSSR